MTGSVIPSAGGEPILHSDLRRIDLLVARQHITIAHARYETSEQVAGPHMHRRHTDAFYVLEGELTFEIGPEPEETTIAADGSISVPPGVVHSFRTDGPARWLTIHTPDGGFAAFMRGTRDGVQVDWDIFAG